MFYKSILNVVGVVVSVAAVMLVGCGGDDNPAGGGGKGSDINNYKTVVIGTQRWMAENLDNAIAGSVCYDSLSSNCAKYGRLYTWDAAMKACPVGWHLPSDDEWRTLTDYVRGDSLTEGRKLKSTSGWDDNGNGTDDYGFSALPGGYWEIQYDSFNNEGEQGYWWSSTDYDRGVGQYARNRRLSCRTERVDWDVNNSRVGNMNSVRCVED